MSIFGDLTRATRDYIESREPEAKSFTLLSPDDIRPQVKAQMHAPFPSSGTGYGYGTFNDLYDALGELLYKGSKRDYAREVGDLLQNSLIMAAVRWLGRTLPEARIYVSEMNSEGKETKQNHAHPMIRLLRRPNPYYGGKLLWKAFAVSWIVDSNVYFWKIRNAFGEVIQLYYLPHYMVSPHWPQNGSAYVDYYAYRVGGKTYKLKVEDVIHFRDGIDPRNIRSGLKAVQAVYRELFSDNERANFSAAMLKNWGVGRYLVTPTQKGDMIPPDKADKLRNKFQEGQTGDNRGKAIVASAPVDVKQLSFSPQELDLGAASKVPEERTASVVGPNGIVLGFGSAWERAIFHNVEEAKKDAYESFLMPLHSYVADEFDTQLLPEWEGEETDDDERPQTTDDSIIKLTKWNYDEVRALQEDRDKKSARTIKEVMAGIRKPSDAQPLLGMDKDPALEDVYYLPRGVVVTNADEIGMPAETDKENGEDNILKFYRKRRKRMQKALGDGTGNQGDSRV